MSLENVIKGVSLFSFGALKSLNIGVIPGQKEKSYLTFSLNMFWFTQIE